MAMKKSWHQDLFLIFLLVSLTFIVWRELPNLIIRADGFIYLLSYFQNQFFKLPFFFTGFETQAFLVGSLLAKLFGAKMSLYYWTELTVMILINIVFYSMVRAIFKNRITAFAAALIFSVNYWGLWDIHTNHCYCFFLERIPNVILSLIGFCFLHLSLERASRKYYLLALVFYFFSLGISHFSLLNTAPWLFYPFFWQLFNHRRVTDILRGGLMGAAFLGISVLIVLGQRIHESGLGPKYGLIEFFLHPEKYFWPDMILRQLTYWSQYPFVLIRGVNSGQLIHQIGVMNAVQTTRLVLIAYIIASLMIYKKLPQQRAMLFTILFAVPTNFLVNGFFGQYQVFDHPGSNRYLYFPTFWLSFFWAMFLWAVFFRKGRLLLIMGVIILCFYYLESYVLISENFQTVFDHEKSTKAVYNYIIKSAPKMVKNTLIVGPYDEIGPYEERFFTEQLGRGGEIKIMSEYNVSPEAETWQKVAENSKQVIKLEYDKGCSCVKEKIIK